jgi:YbbR domain-containing protein
MRVVKHNWPVKLLALSIAVVLSVYVRGQQDRVRTTLVLPVIIPAPEGQRVVEPSAGAKVQVDLEGPAELIRTADPADIKLIIDTSGVKPGKTVRVPVALELPERLRRQTVEATWRPQSIPVKLISDATKLVTVEVNPLEKPEGWELTGPPLPAPAQVTVSGSEEDVNRVARIIASLPLEPTERGKPLVSVRALDAGGLDVTDTVKILPAQVLVSVNQERVVLQKDVPVQPVFRAPPGVRVTAEVVPAQVRLIGPERRLSRILVLETEPFNMPPGRTPFTKETALVPLGGDVTVRPSRVKVTIRTQPLGAAAPRPH